MLMLVERMLLSSCCGVTWFFGATLEVGSLLFGYEMFCWESLDRSFSSSSACICLTEPALALILEAFGSIMKLLCYYS
jgi:hypothetical protein